MYGYECVSVQFELGREEEEEYEEDEEEEGGDSGKSLSLSSLFCLTLSIYLSLV